MQAAGDHQMQHQPKFALHSYRDAFSNSAEFSNAAPFHVVQWWVYGSKQKGASQAYSTERLAHDPRLQRVDIGRNIWQLRHEA